MIRRAIGTTLAGLCALTGPLAGSALSAAGPTLTLSGLSAAASARPGVPFSVAPTSSCPSDDGVQTVEISFTDRAGVTHPIGTAQTDADGAWSSTRVQLPVTGLDSEGNWTATPVAAGAGSVGAICFTAGDPADEGDGEETEDPGEPGDEEIDPGEETDPGDETPDPGDEDVDPGEDEDGADPSEDEDFAAASEDEDVVTTQTYTSVALKVGGSAPKLTLSAGMIKPGGSVTVTASEDCLASGTSQVRIAVIALANGTGDGEEPPAATVTTSATGSWAPVTLTLPAHTPTGDYAVTADCAGNGTTSSSYDAEPFALGTVVIHPAVCGAKSVFTPLTGTYTGELAGNGDVSLPSKLALAGDGPWNVKVRSAVTSRVLAARTLACDKPRYDVDGSKAGLSGSNKPRVKACNTGRAPVVAILQVQAGKKYQKADKETLAPGACTWLEGPKLDRGKKVKARLLIDAPGKASDGVVASFTVKRAKH